MTDYDPGPLDIWNVPRYDQGDFFKLVGCVLFVMWLGLFGCEAEAQTHQYAVIFKCPTENMNGGVSTDDKELMLAAMLVYLEQITPEQFIAFIDDPNVKNNAIAWLESCLGKVPGKEM